MKPDKPKEAAAPMSPGDEARPGTPGTGEDICPGTGRIVRGIGGA